MNDKNTQLSAKGAPIVRITGYEDPVLVAGELLIIKSKYMDGLCPTPASKAR